MKLNFWNKINLTLLKFYSLGISLHNFSPDIVRHWQRGPSVQEDLDDLVVVPVRRQHQRGDVGGERRGVRRNSLPALKKGI